jgi:hypothetical protein
MDDITEFVVIVPPAPKSQADRSFREWLHQHGLLREELNGDDVRIDIYRSEDQVEPLLRYWVRKSVVLRIDNSGR